MNVLITGGAGYVGTELVLKLAENTEVSKIVVYDNLSRENYNLFINSSKRIAKDKIQFEFGDLLDSRKIRKVLTDIDVVYHLAARVSTPFSNADNHLFEQVNHWGTAELVYAVEEIKTVKQFIYLSSCSVYGSGKTLLDESSDFGNSRGRRSMVCTRSGANCGSPAINNVQRARPRRR